MEINKKELKELLGLIDKYDDAYYNKDEPLISDSEYDIKKNELKELSKAFVPKEGLKADKSLKIRLDDAITRVGAPPPLDGKWKKLTHEVSMQSLNKSNTPSDLLTWLNKCKGNKTSELFVTEKLDGISVSLKYIDGVLIHGATRGNGTIGENITRNVKKMQFVPYTLPEKFSGHIRGEIVLLHSDWKKYFPEMANPRNAASGVAKRIDGYGADHLSILTYTIEGPLGFALEENAFEYLRLLGFRTPNYSIGNYDYAVKQWNNYMKSNRNELDYDIDGLVIRFNDIAHQALLGEENHRPKGAIAFKFDAPEAETIVKKIDCQVGDIGRITPVVYFETIELLGANVKKASLHNFSLVKELGIDVGAKILVSKRNDVIPYVENVIEKTNTVFQPPNKCPCCGTKTKMVGEYLICPNKETCPPQVIGRLNKWIGELGILEWGESILTKLIDSGKVKDVADLYRLTKDDISSLDRMGEKSAENLIKELDKFRKVPLENLLGGLCIDGIATSTVKSVIKAGYDSLDKIRNMSISDFEDIEGFGDKRSLAFHNGLIENQDRINDILSAGVVVIKKDKGNLNGKSFCITGTMSIPRAKLQQMISDAGGEIEKKVNKSLDFLVIDDPTSTSSKAKAARKNNITLILEEELMKMLN